MHTGVPAQMGPNMHKINKNGPQINGPHLFGAHLEPILLFGAYLGPIWGLVGLIWAYSIQAALCLITIRQGFNNMIHRSGWFAYPCDWDS